MDLPAAVVGGSASGDGQTITGTSSSEVLVGGAGDDTIDGRGGNDTIDGGGGTDTAIFSANRSQFDLSTLSGVTRMVGLFGAGEYTYDTKFLTNVEKLQFTDTTLDVPASSNTLIIGTTSTQTLQGTAANETIHSRSGNDMIDGGGGTDTAIFFENRAYFDVTTLSGITRVVGRSGAGEYTYDTKFLTNVEKLQFKDMTLNVSVAITPDSATVTEGGGNLIFTINRLGALPNETLYVSTWQGEGSANQGDYSPLLNVPLGFTAGQTSQTVTLTLLNDGVAEQDETFALLVQQQPTDPGNVYLAKTQFTIADDDRPNTGYQIAPAAGTPGEGDGELTVTISRTGGLQAETVYLSTLQTEGFLNRDDYGGLLNEPVIFAAGETSKAVAITIHDDTLAEGNENFALIVQRHGSDPASVHLARATFTIVDNDTLTVDDYAGTTATAGQIAMGQAVSGKIDWYGDTDWFRVDLFAGVTYQFDLRGQSSGSGTLEDPFVRLRDSSGEPTSNAFSDGGGVGRDARLTYAPLADGTYYLAAGTGYEIDGTGTYTISVSVPAMSAGTYYAITPQLAVVEEGAGTLQLTLQRMGASPPDTVYVSTVHGIRNGFASNSGNSDYTGLKGLPVSFGAGEMSATFTIDVRDDTLSEGSESFGLLVQSAPNDPIDKWLARSSFTILDDELSPTHFRFSPLAPVAAGEDSGSILITVHRPPNLPAETIYASTGSYAGGPVTSRRNPATRSRHIPASWRGAEERLEALF